LGRIQELEEHHAVDPDHGIVLGDHLLGRHVQHLLHHVEPRADRLDERRDQVQAGRQRARVAPEPFDRVLPALRHHLDAQEYRDQGEAQDHQHHEREPADHHSAAPLPACAGFVSDARLTSSLLPAAGLTYCRQQV
jgi:hypothetical protein